MSDFANFDWAALNAKLPTARNQRAERKKLFELFDPNGNGYLSLAEVDLAIKKHIEIGEVFDAKPAIMRAFQSAKCLDNASGNKIGEDYITFLEFRKFLEFLRRNFEYYVAFERVNKDYKDKDADGNRIKTIDDGLSLEEFKAAEASIREWVKDKHPDGENFSAEKEFPKIDTNGGGMILFDEFCKWAIKYQVDIEDDVE